jgi:HK97 family phage major capsid protein
MANDTYKNLVERMGAVYAEMKTLVDAANVDGEMAPAMEEKYSQLKLQYANLEAQRTRNQELMGMDKTVTPSAPEVRMSERTFENTAKKQIAAIEHRSSEQYRDAFNSYLARGEHTNPMELRVLNEGTGGSYLMPIEYDALMTAKISTMTCLRNLSRKLDIGSFSREFVYEGTTATAYWPGEATAPTEAVPTFDKITLTPKRLSAIVRISNELVEDTTARGNMSVASIMQEQFARVFAQTEEAALLPHTNVSGAPTSLFNTASLPTSAAGASTITAQQIIDWVYSLPRQYRVHPSCAMIVADSTLAALRALTTPVTTTTSGAAAPAYFWQNGYQNGGSGSAPEPDRIMGIPVYTSAAVAALASGKFVGLLGAFDYCLFASAQNYEVKVLRELYAATNEIGIVANSRIDSKLLLPTLAFTALKCA